MWLLKFAYYTGKSGAKAGCAGAKIRQRSSLRQAALKGKQNEVGTAAHAELTEQVRNVKLHSAFRNVKLAGNLFVGKIFEQRIENFLLAAAEIRYGIGLQPTSLTREDGIDETGEKLARNPESAAGNKRESADQLVPGFNVREKAFHTETKERKAIGIVVLLADDDEASLGIAFEKIGQKRAGGGLCGMSVNDVNLGARRLKGAQVRRKGGFQLLENNLELGLCQNAFELAQHQRMRREDANRQFGRSAFRSHCSPA